MVTYDSGEIMFVSIFGSAENIDVRLEKTEIYMEPTSISLSSTKTVRINNQSEFMVKYSWKRLSNELEEDQARAKAILKLADQVDSDHGMIISDAYNRTHQVACILTQNKIREIKSDSIPYHSSILDVSPSEGAIWPNSFAEVVLTFLPTCSGAFAEVAFCEIGGRETRLPLQIWVSYLFNVGHCYRP